MCAGDAQGCMACHAIDRKLVGPSFREIARSEQGGDTLLRRLPKIRAAGRVWGTFPMPAQAQLNGADAELAGRGSPAGASK
jgi:cytochrome c